MHTTQEKLILKTQVIQNTTTHLDNLIKNYQDLKDKGCDVYEPLDTLLQLQGKVGDLLLDLVIELTETMTNMDALSEEDINIISPVIKALIDEGESK